MPNDSPISGTFAATITGAYIVASGTTDTVVYEGATFGNSNDAVLVGGGTLESSGYVNVYQYGGNTQLQLTDGITWENAGTVYQGGVIQFGANSGDSATIVNEAGAIFDLTTGNSQLNDNGSGTYSFVNAGTLEMTGGGGDTVSAALNNSGLVTASNGDFYLAGPVANTGTLQSDGGFLEVEGGVLGGTIQTLGTTGNTALVGTYTFAVDTTETVTFGGAYFGWDGTVAVLEGPGTLQTNGSVNVYQYGGSTQLQLAGGITWENTGTVDQGGGVQFGAAGGDTATIINEAGAVYDLTTGNSQLSDNGSGTYSFVNAGTLEMTGGGGDTVSAALNNSGLVTANNGDFYLAGPVANTGTLQSDGGFLEVEGGVLGGTIQTLGTTGNTALIDTYTFAVDTTETVTFGGAYFGWDGTVAVLEGPGTLQTNGSVNVYQYGGSTQLQLAGGITWENTGTVDQDGVVQLGAASGDTATIINEAGAVYDLTTGNSQLSDNGSGTYNFINAGILEMTAGGASDTVSAVLNNSGLVTANGDGGDLYVADLVANTGTLQSDGSFLEVQGGVLGGTIQSLNTTVGTVTLVGTVALVGTYVSAASIHPAIDNSVTLEGAYFGWDGSVAVLEGPGTLQTFGSVNVYQYGGNTQLQLAGGITWENAGTVDQGGVVQFGAASGDTATIINETGAVYDLTTGNSQLAANGAGTYNFINDGTLEMTPNGVGDTVSVALNNSGLVTANGTATTNTSAGYLYVVGGFTNSGTLQADGGVLQLQGGVLGGTIQVNSTGGGSVVLIGNYAVASGTSDVAFGGVTFGNSSDAVLDGPGTLVSSGVANVYQYGGNTQLQLAGGVTWENTGTVYQAGAVQFGAASGDAATLINEAGADYQLTTANSALNVNGSGTYSFVNDGMLEMNAAGNSDYIYAALTNNGLLSANAGELEVAGGFTNSGTIQTAGGSVILFGGVLGGTIAATDGGITLVNTYTSVAGTTDTVALEGVTFGNSSDAVLAGPGTLASSGYATVYEYGGNTQLQLTDGITWDNAGTLYENGAVLFGSASGDSATLVNEAGGIIEFTTDNSGITNNGAGTYSLVDAGLLEQTTSGGTSIDVSIDETSTGIINAGSGDLTFNGGGTIAGLVEGSDTVNFNGGNVTLAATGDITVNTINFDPNTLYMDGGTISSPNLSIAAGDEVIGYGTLDNVQNNGTIIAEGGVLVITGSVSGSGVFETGPGGVLEFTGTVAGTYTNTGLLELDNNATLTTTAGFINSGDVYVNNDGTGGGALTVGGTLTNSNYIEIGDYALATTVTAQGLDNTGQIDIDGGDATEQATLSIAADAPATWTGIVNVRGDGLLEFGGTSGIGTIATSAQINLSGAQAIVAASGLGTTSDTALTGLAVNAGQLDLVNGASLTTTGGLVNSGDLYLDNNGDGGSSLTIGGTLTNSNYVDVGDYAQATTLTAQGLANTGQIDIDGGDATEQATLSIAADAPATWTGILNVRGDGLLEFGGTSGIGTIASGAQINLSGSQAVVAASGLGTTSDTALTGLAVNAGQLDLVNGASLTTTGGLVNSGDLYLDNDGNGGSSLTIGGTLTNSNYVEVGDYAQATTLTAQGLANTGQIDIDGGDASEQATLSIAADAPAIWTGIVDVSGNGLLEFGGTGGIGTIAGGSQINLSGSQAVIAASSLGTTTDSALTGLTTNAGQLDLVNGASLAITGGLDNSDYLYLDSGGNGGSSLAIDGTLTNSGDVFVGNGGLATPTTMTVGALANTGYVSVVGNYGTATAGATLDVNTTAGFGTAGVLTGSVFIDGYGVIEFTGGQIGTIAGGASLELRDNGELADAGSLGSNSALTGLTENDGNLAVRYGNAISLTGNLLNTGNFYLQDQDNNAAVSVNSIAGTLTNSGDVYMGNLGLTAPTTLTVGALVNTGYLSVVGDDATATQGATLDVNTIAGFGTTGVLTGSVYIDGTGVIEFTGGQIGTIAGGASLELRYQGELADAGSLGSNSALTGLTENDGNLAVRYGNAISLTGNLLNTGNFYLQDEDNNALVSSNTIAGTLTNSGDIYIGNLGLTAPTTLTVGALVNTGYISVVGDSATATQGATLDVNTIAGFGTTGVLTGSVYIDGTGVIEFTGGQIGTIASGAVLELRYLGELADAGNLGSNSALTGLTENDGVLAVRYGNEISLTGNLLNTGDIYLQDEDNDTLISNNTIAGTLTNTGDIFIGNSGLTAPTSLTVGALDNSNYLSIAGNTSTPSDSATLTVDGAASSSDVTNIGSNATVDVTGTNTYTVTGGDTDVSGLLAAGTIVVDPVAVASGVLQLSGGTLQAASLTITSGATLLGFGIVQPAITSVGIIEATGGSLDLQGGLAAPATVAIENASALELAGADSGNVDFAGPNGTFVLDDPVGFTGTIGGLALGDTLVLNDTTATVATSTFDSATDTSTLAISLAGGGTIDLTLAGNYAGETFSVNQAGTNSEVAPIGTAAGTIVTATPINFGEVHTGTTVTEPLEIMNNGPAGAADLDVTVGALSGDATASGSITELAPQATDSTDISVGINTDNAGMQTGTVTLDFASDVGGGNTSPLPSQSVGVSGTVYGYANPSVTAPSNLILHVGDDGGTATEALTVANIAPTSIYYEGLDAAATGAVTGNLISASGGTGDIAAGGSDTSSVTVSFSTATAGYVTGTAIVALTSDGTGIDTLGLTPLDGATYSAVNNFSTASNANGVWSYESNGTLLADTSSGSNYEEWSNGGSPPNEAFVTLNPTTTTQTYSGTVVLPPSYLDLDPQDTGNAAVQFTAPTAGVYTFTGNFLGVDTGEQAHAVAIDVNGTAVASGTISSYGQTIAIDLTQTLAAGSTVDFVSDSGASYNNLGTGLSLTVTTATGDAVPVTAVIDNYATAAIQQAGSAGVLSQVGNTYTLDLGTFANGVGTVSDTLDVANTAAGPADWLSGSLIASVDTAFSNTGLGTFGTLGAGGTTPLSVDLSTTNAGVFTQTITLAATDSNASGYSEALAGETIDVVGTVLPSTVLANPVINNGTTIVLPDAHVAAVPNDQTTLSISNTGSAVLGAVVSGSTGSAYGSGQITQLAVGGTDTTDITVGLNNTSAGAKSGNVTVGFASGGDNLLTNGSFEDASDFVGDGQDGMLLSPGSTILQGWTVVGTYPIGWYGPTNDFGLSAEDGSYFLDLTGYADTYPYGGVTQTIATTIGEQYQLSFWLGSSSIWGLPDSLTASAGGTSETFTSTLTGSNNWQFETLDFTATGTATTISLVGTSPAQHDIGLDNVAVESLSEPTPVALNPQTVEVSGNVYNYATASITVPANVYLHVGDDGGSYTENLTVANTAATGLYSEGLEVSAVGGAGGAVTGVSGTTGDIAAGGSDDTSLSVTFSTAAAATGGEVAVAETSDGAGIDSLGTTSLGTVDVPVSVTVDNYATAAVEQLGGDGTLTPSGVANTYTLDLGSTEQYSSALTADLGALNAALGPAADVLDGNFSISGDSEFSDTGFSSFNGVTFGNADGGNDVVLNTGTIGTFTQQIVLDPTGSNASGYSGTLTAETIDVVGTIVPVPPPPPPPLPVAIAWGDVHLTTFDGLYYNFQAEGEFVLAQSTVAGDTFQVQARLQPYSANSTVSVMTMMAAEVGTDRVTFGLGRADTVWVDGAPVTFGGNGSSITLSGGTITQVSSTSYQVAWNTGEVMDVTDAGTYLNMSLTLSASDGPGSIQGLLGSDSGQANDFVANGTVLPQPLSSSTLYGEFADAWRVTDSSSLMDYLAGQTTATFTDDNFPADAISLDSLPAAIVAAAEQEVIAAGITDPNLQAAAVIDLLVTGDPNSLLNDLDINQTGEVTDAAVINSPAPPVPALGVTAAATNVIENASGTTTVTFTAYLTAATGTDTVIDWAVTAPNGTFLGATSFGGTLPSGFVVVPAGQTTTNFTVSLPTGVLGTNPSGNLQVTIASTNGDPIFGQTAQTEIDNYQPEPGNPVVPVLTLLSGAGTFSGSDGNYTLNVGTLVAGEQPLQDRFQFSNDALAPSDLLTGSIAASGSGFTVYGDEPLTALAAGSSYQGLVTETDSNQTGTQSETIVISPVDENITGYSSIMPSQTVTVTDTVISDAVGTLETSGPINLGTFYEGDFAETALSIMNAATAGSAGLDVTATSSGQATATGEISDLAPGATDSSTIIAGINTSAPGVQTGTITLNYASDAGNGNTAADGSAQIEIIGTVYGPATAAIAASPVYVHIGDDGGSVTVPITVSNTAPNNGDAENLDAQVVSFGTYVTSASGSIVDLKPQFSNDTSLTATLSDANYGIYAGEVAIDLQSDGTGIDSEGTTSLGIAYVQAAVDVDQYAVAAMEQISGNGTMVPTGVATNYALDLGTVAQYATPLGANLGVLNDVLGQADLLGGSFTIAGAPEFENIGFTPFGSGTETAGLAAGQVDNDPVIVLSSGTVGVFTETITLDPIGYNPSGYSGTLTPETVTITGTVVAAPPPVQPGRVADAWGDVHLTTFDGLYYNFQAQGEFVLTESTVPGDTFEIQARMQPWSSGSSVSVNTMIAAEVGSDRVTFAIDRPDTVWIDGVAQTMSSPVVNLADGTLEQTSANSYQLIWNTGEELQITDDGTYLNASISLPSSDAGNVQGLLGPDNGNPADDLELPGGTPIATGGTVTYAELYGQFANAWRVTDGTSLMDYSAGQDTGSFTNVDFPYNQISLGNLPANAVALAEAAAEAAGITDPNLLQAAVEDYLFTGNPDALEASANVQEQEGTTGSTAQTLTAPPPVVANVGVEANVPTMIESATIAESVGFTIYLTSPEANATTIDYAVTDPGPGYLDSADFGGILPSGTVTIQAGQTTALFTVELPAAVLGSQADENLQVTISPQDGETVFAPQAQTEILNTGPTAGNPAQPAIEGVSGNGDLTGGGTSYVLNLGTVEQFSNPLEAGYGVLNNGTVPADLLSGSFVVNGSTLFLNSGLGPFDPIAAGAADTAPVVEMLTNTVGTFTEDVVLTPTDSNATGYDAVLNQVTLEITGTVTAPPPPPPPPEAEATAWGDVHITTFDGVYYNFQAAGEYVLTRSTVAGDTFQVQARLQPWTSNSSVTVQTQVGAAIGSDDVVFALTGAGLNASPLYLNGTAEALGIGQTLSLSDGSVTETSANTYLVDWNTGESMTVTLDGSYISDTIELTAADAGNVQGLLGPDDGNPSTDLQLPDGQSIASNGTIASSTLYGEYASAWQVPSQSDSLLYYTAGQSPSAFLIPGFPEDALTLSQLPANLVAAAEAIVEAEGITNPNLIDAAVIDLLVTGNPNSVFSTENVQEEGVLLSSAAVSIPTPLPSVGIMADSTSVLEPTTGTLAVDYTIYLTAAAAQTSTIDYSVTGSGPNNLGTADIVGGTGSGSVQIAAGQTSVQVVVDVLANALGSLPDAELQVGVTATGGESLFGGSAETEIVNPTPTAGNPAVALMERLGGDGDLTGSGTSYVLNMGTQVQNGPALFGELGIENGATVPADDLSGQFSITNFTEFLNTGFDPFSSVAPGAADTEPVISLNTGTIGVYTETVVLDPTDTNPTGYSAPMNDVTLTVTGTIVPMPLPPPPPVPTATAFGDVHLTTFDGLYYNFQAVGEFTLAKSTVAGDSFNVQVRTQQWSPGATVSVIGEVAAGIGSNAVTFGLSSNQPYTVMLNGAQATFTNGVLTLADGTVTEESPSTYVVDWNTGESMTVSIAGSYISTTVALAAQDENGNVEGLLGYDNGVNNDFAPVVSGTTITTAQLYYGSGEAGNPDSLADYWRLTQADSLLYYAPGTDTANYTDRAFPADPLTFADLPTGLQQEGMQEAIQAGITDPQLQQAAALDFIVTGDPDIVSAGQNVQQQGIITTDTDVTGGTATPALGVSANNAALVEGSGDLSVGFTVYLTAAEAQATTVDYTVTAPDAAYLGASAFGGTLPSGSVTIAAGQTSATFSVTVPASVLGALPSSDLQVTITPTGGESVFAPSAQTTIVNSQVESGTASVPEFALLSGLGTLTQNGNAYTLNLGNLQPGGTVQALGLAIENAAAAGGNALAGTLTDTSGSGFTVSGTGPLPTIAAGDSYQGLHIAVNTDSAGDNSETITFAPVDQNASGYSSDDAPLTLTITDTVSSVYASASAVTPNPVNFGIVHVGQTVTQALSVTNTAASGAENLDGSIGSAIGSALTNSGSFTGLAPGLTNSTSLVVGLSTTTDGVESGTATVSLESDGTGIDSNGITDLASQTIDVTGTVDNYATAAIAEISGGGTLSENGNSYTLTLGTLTASSSPVDINLGISNIATGLADLLSGSLDIVNGSGVFINNGDTAFAGLAAAQADIAPTITLSAGTDGTFTETITLNAVGSNASGYSGTLAPETLTVTGVVVQDIVLTTHVDIVNGANNVTIVAATNTLSGGDEIDGGGGVNTLELEGGGTFNLAAPATLENIQVVDATEGQSAAMPTIFLRDGTDLTLNLASAATNPQLAGAVVHGADNDDTINLGAGDDSVQLGGIGETVNGGSGTDIYYVTDVTIGGTIVGGSGTNQLDVQGGGTVAMGASITGIGNVFLLNSGTAYDFTANDTADMVIHAGTDSATITVGAASQSVYGSSGTLLVLATAAEAGVAVEGVAGATANDTLEITTGGTITLNSADHNITVQLDVASTLVLPTNPTVAIDGSAGNDAFVATAGVLRAGQQIDGGGGTNTLELEGGGTFNLAAPATLENIQVVDATEGESAAMPTIFLRDGTDLTLNLASAATNPQLAGAVVHGADNDDTINLGAGDDSVQLGGIGETVNGGSGTDIYYVTDVTIGGTIVGGTGTNQLDVQGGGTMTMGASITGIGNVFLLNSGTAYDFTANDTADMVIHAGTDSATITVGAASQSVYGSSGTLLVLATAAEAGVAVEGVAGATANDTLEITTGGTITLNSADRNITVQLDVASTLVLPTNPTVAIDGSAGNDVFVATSGVLRAGQQIDGGGGTNTLELEGDATFNLAAPAALENIQVVDATEGQSSGWPIIYLRNGLDLTLNLTSAATSSLSVGAVVFGADDNDIINLGSGNDTVHLGSAGEAVYGGGGNNLFYVTSATIGAIIDGGSGTNTLDVEGGGTMAMGTNITGIHSVYLENAGTSYDFTANDTADMVIHASTDSDTITVGSASQTVAGSSGNLLVLATAADAGVVIRAGTGSNELEITTGGTFTVNSNLNNITVQLDAASTLTLNHMEFIHAVGSGGNDVIIAGAAGQVLTGGEANDTLEDAGHYGVTFQDTIAGFADDTLADFSKVDTIDVTNLNVGSVTGSPTYTGGYGASSSGTLAVATGSGTIDIKLTGLAAGGIFSTSTDGHGGTFVTYS